MARQALTGTRVRDRRLLLGLKQADLARAVGMSAAYLNLIEHNRRRVGGALLEALAAALKTDPATLAEGAEGAVFDALREAAAHGEPGVAPEVARAEEFVSRFPGWAALLAARQGQVERLSATVEGLSERMTHDPFLAASLHEVLSAITAVRSTSAILAETQDIEPEWRERFQRNIHEDSLRLSNVSVALVAWLDQARAPETGLASPQEELESWLAAQGWHLPAIEVREVPSPDRLIAGAAELASPAARELAAALIRETHADAQALPRSTFLAALARIGPDPVQLATAMDVPPERVFRRLALLPPGQGPEGLGLVIADASGTLLFRRPAPGFPMPRFGGACALWPLYDALTQPHVPFERNLAVAGRVGNPTGGHFRTHSWCSRRWPEGGGGPQVLRAHMLILPLSAPQPADLRLVGPSCRICLAHECVARREPSILN